MLIEERLQELGIVLPAAPVPVASYTAYRISGSHVYVSGQGPIIDGVQMYKGKVGLEYSLEEGYQAARLCGLNLIAILKNAVGDLDRVKQIVHLKGFVACADDFYAQPQVINGASDLMKEVFGEKGVHTRCALGTNALPLNLPVEIELIAEV
jgi:enamine deaminase RidA (YjgF/YER057c/UK114 family)